MTDSPFGDKEPRPETLDGYVALLLVLSFPIVGPYCGLVGSGIGHSIGDYAREGEAFGYVSLYALSIGYAQGGLRFGRGSDRRLAVIALIIDILLPILLFPAGHL